ncbi:DUF523 domain-containing protein [Enhygromyxa salina]|uniref:DUF523 domain-containing protein n=1 Tax=Enhygromyxa salina TaxID=215803 RepID=UPI0015E7E48C|nr:DUF523 domain-containing protein [Enhygromyxa salina]
MSGPRAVDFRPTSEDIAALPVDPLRLLVSACIAGVACANDGDSRTQPGTLVELLSLATVEVTRYCPEHEAFGSPRELCDIVGGDGFDVLDGLARVLTASGVDWTAGLVDSAARMVELARRSRVDVAILMDTSAACGSQVIYDGDRSLGRRVPGQGVCAAALARAGVWIISHRDFRSLEVLRSRVDPSHEPDPDALDYPETEWYRRLFPSR